LLCQPYEPRRRGRSHEDCAQRRTRGGDEPRSIDVVEGELLQALHVDEESIITELRPAHD
jgi:hypothetical protein